MQSSRVGGDDVASNKGDLPLLNRKILLFTSWPEFEKLPFKRALVALKFYSRIDFLIAHKYCSSCVSIIKVGNCLSSLVNRSR